MRSPLTAVAFMLELTDDILVLPALLIGCVAAQTVTVSLMRRSILTEKVARRGYHVMREYLVNPLARSRVEDVMQRDAPTVPARYDRRRAVSSPRATRPDAAEQYAWPILDPKGALVGIVTGVISCEPPHLQMAAV